MEVSGWLHTPGHFTPGKERPSKVDRKLCGSWSQSACCGVEINLLPWWKLDPGSLAFSAPLYWLGVALLHSACTFIFYIMNYILIYFCLFSFSANRFALLETKIALVHLLSHFELHTTSKTQLPLRLTKGFKMTIEGGFWCGFKLRKPTSNST